ncbi:YifB family Mg chelatase-like AAA ATPase [Aureibacter tunicatorum]|uniref:Magnesium chelatase family protein n=1 Tax=Aureibacter tunicatorum TaxID=866807 RepID=A0AAE4BR30_9BACT|nr:YifB family Mg chelatase-like AAA ATPase [Aureibacter tunicatorum]MDR6239799.1 magnesium chelatase family protein [Aureibacter tunicatorum]BDD04274.1 magnesium chelatase [Aureibacter tunicatorum]
MLSKTYGAAVFGVNAMTITIETSVGQGAKFFMVGLPDNAVKESQQRVESAIKHNGFFMPRNKIVVNLAPADIRKEGSSYDLPIALAILKASSQITASELEDYLIMGELALDGTLRPIKGALPIAIEARKKGFKGFIVPMENAREAAIVNNLEVIGVENLSDAISHLNGIKTIAPLPCDTRDIFNSEVEETDLDFGDVKGQENIKRALEIAAAGGHNVIMIGPPGAGKTMLAKRLPSILPPLTLHEALETTKIHSVAGKLSSESNLISKRPFRSPHHTVSDVALVGGGSIPQPGEISLAHNGVLFLDELTEFKRNTLEVMRQPLENREVTISRAKISVDFPANFMLIASMNPTPYGFQAGKDGDDSFWSPETIQKAMSRISGPLLDRIDMHMEVSPVSFDEMTSNRSSESSATIRERVIQARNMQNSRFEEIKGIHCNAMMPSHLIKKYCEIDQSSKLLLKTAMNKLGFSARAYDRILKLSRTIADLSGSESIKMEHIAEAVQYRTLDRESANI